MQELPPIISKLLLNIFGTVLMLERPEFILTMRQMDLGLLQAYLFQIMDLVSNTILSNLPLELFLIHKR